MLVYEVSLDTAGLHSSVHFFPLKIALIELKIQSSWQTHGVVLTLMYRLKQKWPLCFHLTLQLKQAQKWQYWILSQW